MNQAISMSIRISGEELDKLKQAAMLEAYASYSEFIRKTVLIEVENGRQNIWKVERGWSCDRV